MAIFYIHILLCIAITAIMWFMQVVHYPLLPYIDKNKWAEFSEKRRMATVIVTYPLIAFEALTGVTLIIIATQSKSYGFLAASVTLLIVLITYTIAYLNPLLKKIDSASDDINHQKFLKAHWVRTLGWTARLLLLILVILASAQE